MNNLNYRKIFIDKMSVPVEAKEIKIGRNKTSYLVAGSGEPVVCLHGAGAGAVTWYPSISTLAKSFQVIVPDIK